ncbi:hypothetical protein ACTHQ1_02575 [Janibacter anophelis]|uniref:hypothetical protein n=1 Tax=Janibacter anophelis TaxID=319054 RepID=UPI003F7F7202
MSRHAAAAVLAGLVAAVGAGCSGTQEVELLGDDVHILVMPEPRDGTNEMLSVATLGLDEQTGCVIDVETGRPVAFPEGTLVDGDRESWKVVSSTRQEFTDGDVVQGGGDHNSDVGGHAPEDLPSTCGPPPWNVIVTELGPGTRVP